MPIPGRSRIGGSPVSRRIGFDASSLSIFQLLLLDKEARRIFMVHCHGYDPVADELVHLKFIDDVWYGDKAHKQRVVSALTFKSQVVAGGAGENVNSSVGAGDIILAPTGEDIGELDYLTDLAWDDRDLEVLMGGERFLESEFEPVFSGISKELVWGQDSFNLSVSDTNDALKIPMQEEHYLGTGGDEGGEEINGDDKPLGFGECINVTPIKIDDNLGSPIYQVHSGPIERVDITRDMLLDLTAPNGGLNDVTEMPGGPYADVRDVPLLSSEWCQDVSKGIFRLASPPEGKVTCNFRGATFAGRFVQRAWDLALEIIRTYGKLPDSKISLSTFARLDAETQTLPNGGNVNLHITSTVNVEETVRAIMQSVFAYQTYTSLGQVAVFQFRFQTPALIIDQKDVVSISKRRSAPPQFRRTVHYARNWTVFSESDFGLGVTDEQKEFFRQEVRSRISEDDTIRDRRLSATEAIMDTLLDGEYPRWTTGVVNDDAGPIADQSFALMREDRQEYEVVIQNHAFRNKTGQTALLTYNRWGLDAGVECIIVGLGEDSNSGHTTLSLWR